MITAPPRLETQRLILRGFEKDDFAAVADMWADEDVVRFIGGKTRSAQDAWFASVRVRGMWPVLGYGYWVVTDKETGGLLGETGFADFKRGINPELSIHPEAGWAFAKTAWGRGIGKEAVGAIHAWLDDALPGPSYCIMDPENAASRRVAEATGYKKQFQSVYLGEPVDVYRREMPD